ncbi:FUSC family protein, partial [Saccharomonospora iraqiensis]|uniref:FUSC family protein n=1 Tax=Saccharomonospora iraqiensis TaxID=52698 RepID=UPI00022E07D8
YRWRAVRLGGAMATAVAAFAFGLLARGDAVFSVPLVIVVAAVSALVSAAGSNASIAALQLFVFTVLGTGRPEDGLSYGLTLGCFAAGSCWGLLVSLAGWTVRATTPEREAVAQVHLELAGMLSAVSAGDDDMSRAARHQLTRAMNTAYDRLLSARSWLSGRDETYRGLLNLLTATTPAIEASVAVVDSGERPPRAVIAYFTDLATAVRGDDPLPHPPGDVPESPPEIAALYAALTTIGMEEQRLHRARVPLRQRLSEWVSALASGPVTWTVAVRVTLCVALAEAVRFVVPVERSYWITLTVGLIIKPDFGSVFGRAVLRGLGTVAGVGLGAAVVALVPPGIWVAGLVALFGSAAALGKVRSYGLLSAFVTPLLIVQMELSTGERDVALARLEDTALGCAIVLVFGYLLWPGSRRPVLGGRLADVAEEIADYADAALRPVDTAQRRHERSRRRRRAYRALSDLRTVFQQLVVEPSAAGRQAAAWWPAIVALEQLTDAVTAVAVVLDRRGTATPPAESDVRQIGLALAEFAMAVRLHSRPAEVRLPRDERLAGVVEQISAAFDAVTGPDLSTFRPRG